jgi:hypothetical protein
MNTYCQKHAKQKIYLTCLCAVEHGCPVCKHEIPDMPPINELIEKLKGLETRATKGPWNGFGDILEFVMALRNAFHQLVSEIERLQAMCFKQAVVLGEMQTQLKQAEALRCPHTIG